MAGVDGNGLTIKRLPDILDELQTAIKAQYGNDTPLDSSSFFGILNTIYGASGSEVWELLQTINNQFNPVTSTDKWLDDIAAYLKITRLQPTASSGELSLFGTNGAVVPIGTNFSDLNGKVYESTTEGILDTGTSRTPIVVGTTNGVGAVGEPSISYTIVINGDSYTKQMLWPDVALDDIATAFRTLIGDQDDYYAESYTELNPEFIAENLVVSGGTKGTILNIINKDATFPITITVSVAQSPTPDHYLYNVGGIVKGTPVSTFSDDVEVVATVVGNTNTPLNTLINIDTPVVGLDSVYNKSSMISGRDEETDEELRARLKRDGTINSYGTKPAIESNLRQVEGVTFVDVQVNPSYVEDADGRPPNSYECVVIGGQDEDIANTIFNRGSAGIQYFGNTNVTIDDDQGNPQTISFSRANEIYVWVKVYYTKNTEEVFPANGESLMATATLTYGENLTIGSDIIPKRFFGSIYNSTAGIEDLTVKLATSIDPIVEPIIGDFTTDIVSIASNDVSNFANYRIEIIEE